MLTILNVLLFAFLVAYLVLMLINVDEKNIARLSKQKAYVCIAIMAIETISLVIRLLTSKPWFVIFAILVIHVVTCYETIIVAKKHGAFKRKKKTENANMEIVV